VTYDYSLNGQNLDKVSVIRDLGVLMDSILTFSEHVDVIVSKARQMLGFIELVEIFGTRMVLNLCMYRC
jgi:hypothetical protein